jgi:hypothetical protein
MRRRRMVDIETPITVLALALPALVVALALWLPAFALAWQQQSSFATATPGAIALPIPTSQPHTTPAMSSRPAATPTATAGQGVTATPTARLNATNAPRSTLPPTATQAGLTHESTDYATSAGLLLLGGLGLVLLLPGGRRRRAGRASGEVP